MRPLPLFLALTLAALPVRAQSGPAVCPSRVVRWTAGKSTVQGALLGDPAPGDSIRVLPAGARANQTLPWETPGAECRLSKSARGTGALAGLLLGTVGAVVVFSSASNKCARGFSNLGPCLSGASASALLPFAGAAIGAIASHGSEWRPLAAGSPKGQQQISMLFDGKRLGVRVAF